VGVQEHGKHPLHFRGLILPIHLPFFLFTALFKLTCAFRDVRQENAHTWERKDGVVHGVEPGTDVERIWHT
jgi:hypothetical protein